MNPNNSLLPHNVIFGEWESSDRSPEIAVTLTLKQISALEEIISDDENWGYFLKVFNNGRETDAWLALDWPDGFDELLLCVPLCSLVEFECSKCTVGKRQNNNSCAMDYSIFGYTAELIKRNDRKGLINHLESVKKMLVDESLFWNTEKCVLEKV